MENHENEALKAKERYQSAVESAYDYIERFDLLETITNVGNDEVFTPRKTVSMMLDSLPNEVWHNPNYKWLNPATKNGMFEREIAIRLNDGLREAIPDEEKRKKHILQNMIYAFGQTKFTSNVARRTLYYCSEANRKCDGIVDPKDGHYVNGYAIGNGTWFSDSEGNIKTPTIEHWFDKKGVCKFCGIKRDSNYNDPLQREHYAYEFIHYDRSGILFKIRNDLFKGDNSMKFDIIIGNPPYQLSDGGAQASAKPIYHLFINQAIELRPKYLSMIVPSRWMTGGKGLDEFREKMLNDRHFRLLHDYINPKDCFPNNDIKGGVCYFVWDRDHNKECEIITHNGGKVSSSTRYLKEDGADIFIRQEELLSILNKVKVLKEKSLSEIVSARKPYGLTADSMVKPQKYNLPAFSKDPIKDGYKILGLGEGLRREWRYLNRQYPLPKESPCFKKYKVFIAEAYGSGVLGEVPSAPVLSSPGELCTETFLEIGPFEHSVDAENVIKYIRTKFFRTLVGIQKQTQHTTQKAYKFVPMQKFDENNDINWNSSIDAIDEQLFRKYKLSAEDINFINTNIPEMREDMIVRDISNEAGDDDE